MKILSNTDNTDPWGISFVIGNHWDSELLTTVLWMEPSTKI